MKKVLISPLGLSPGVVTSAYHLLEPTYGRMDRIITITTSNSLAELCEREIERELERIEYETGHFVEYSPTEHRLRLETDKREPVSEIRSLGHLRLFARQMQELLHKNLEAGHEVYLNLTGGHKSMIAAAAMAAQFFPPKRVFHLWVDEETEQEGRITSLLKKPTSERRKFMNPQDAVLVRLEIQEAVSKREAEAQRRELQWEMGKSENYKQQLWGRLFEVEVGYYLELVMGYPDVQTGYEPLWAHGDIDVFARRNSEGATELVLAEVKLSQIRLKAVNQAIERRDWLKRHLAASGLSVPDENIHVWMITNSDGEVDDDAREKAAQENIPIMLAKLSRNWESRADWSVTDIHPLE